MTSEKITLQTHVLTVARATTNYGCFDIGTIRLVIAIADGQEYSYRQVRNALYRLRVNGQPFKHLSRGIYKWIA